MDILKKLLYCIAVQGLEKPKNKSELALRVAGIIVRILLIFVIYMLLRETKHHMIFKVFVFIHFTMGWLVHSIVRDIVFEIPGWKPTVLPISYFIAGVFNIFIVIWYLKKEKELN